MKYTVNLHRALKNNICPVASVKLAAVLCAKAWETELFSAAQQVRFYILS